MGRRDNTMGRGLVAIAVLAIAGGAVVRAQLPRPLAPAPDVARVAPFFDGWYANPDGTISFSFGYSNLNKGTVEIPVGPNNFITPKEYDGRQPTVFAPVGGNPNAGGGANAGIAPAGSGRGGAPSAAAADAPAGRGRGPQSQASNYDRERGVFTVTVPAGFKGDIVWTLKHAGQTWTIPGRAASTAYQLSWPMAMGSTPPLIRFQPTGQSARGPVGMQAPPLQAKVGTPLTLTLHMTDDAVHEKEPIPVKRSVIPVMNASWFKHSGPVGATVTFEPDKQSFGEPQGTATTQATFSHAGDYVIRARADTFGNIDSTSADQCCWSNAYWKITVSR